MWCMAQANYSSAGDGGMVKSLLTISGVAAYTNTSQASNWDRSGITWQLTLRKLVRIVDSRAMWSVGKVTKVFPGGDGSVWFAEVQWNDRYYIHQVAKMVAMPKSNRLFCKECACCTNTGMAAENFLLSFEIHITHRPQYGHVAKLAQPPSFLLQ